VAIRAKRENGLNLGSNLAGKLCSNFRRGDPKDLDMTFTNFKRISQSSSKKFIVVQRCGAKPRRVVALTIDDARNDLGGPMIRINIFPSLESEIILLPFFYQDNVLKALGKPVPGLGVNRHNVVWIDLVDSPVISSPDAWPEA
jgi:hypothetical protein